MPCETKWLIEDRMVHVRYYGRVGADDIRGQSSATVALIKQGTPPVHVFIDASDVDGVGIGLGDLRSLSVPTMPEAGWAIIIAPNALYRFFISIGLQFSRGNYKFVGSMREAIGFAAEQDPTLVVPPDIT